MILRCEQTVTDRQTRCTFRLEGVCAASVALVGSFNEWSTTRHLMKRVEGRWETEITLPPGRHEYCFFTLDHQSGLRGSLLGTGSSVHVSATHVNSESPGQSNDAFPSAPLAQLLAELECAP